MADEDLPEGTPETDPSPDAVPAEAAPEATPTPPADTPEPDFTDPATLPPELQALGKRLQASFTKKMQKASEAVELVTRYRSDPEFARQFIAYEAQRMGLSLGTPTAQSPAGAGPTAPPPDDATIAAQALPAELRWLAPAIAQAARAIADRSLAPVRQQLQTREEQEKAAIFDSLKADLSTRYPGWEADEDDVNEWLGWMQGEGPVKHPRFGNRLEVALNAIKGGALAERAALQRQAQAARQASRTGAPSRSVTPNHSERIAKAPTNRDAVAIAFEQAVEQMRRAGQDVPA